nr:myelin transcription factor 1-like [Parasteatoda tepidariorum]
MANSALLSGSHRYHPYLTGEHNSLDEVATGFSDVMNFYDEVEEEEEEVEEEEEEVEEEDSDSENDDDENAVPAISCKRHSNRYAIIERRRGHYEVEIEEDSPQQPPSPQPQVQKTQLHEPILLQPLLQQVPNPVGDYRSPHIVRLRPADVPPVAVPPRRSTRIAQVVQRYVPETRSLDLLRESASGRLMT